MWLLLKAWLAQRAIRWLMLKGLGSLLLLLPVGAALSSIGWPVLVVLAVLAVPVLLFLLVIGLPVLLVLLLGGAMLGLVGGVLALGLPVIKLVLIVGVPVALAVWLVRKLTRRSGPPAPPSAPIPPEADPGIP